MPLQAIHGLLICFHFKDLQLCVGIVRWVIDHVPRWNRDCFGHNGSSIRRKHHWAWCSGSASNLASFIYVSLLIWPTKLPIAIDPGLPGELLPFKEQGFVLGNAHDSDQGCRPSLFNLGGSCSNGSMNSICPFFWSRELPHWGNYIWMVKPLMWCRPFTSQF